ncbi:fluoride efflux transporter CrcB [Amycolatopsis regifaucium]|uniref:Fluoride-specific ion channel FluC n=1 Tax=Amycolatopsis regifaucium TaxID=546365 RepID=A0A154M8F4_9PSEU|nr:fluoride efflux transporter CrcB [Amycolatopsis regifaucium]KZB80650.1 chromosome condensation protein CrcB [Amycolatopsis regifaucium]OKA03107.1 chromosome condensation protein CrcB [Amycolatopsis regifaucium]SFH01727.1 camphor resistance protein CrcB [Amycolatopsis regifaucium]
MTVLFVALGGGAGAILRYLTDLRTRAWLGGAFPWGTLAVNVAGSAVLGFLTGWALHGGQPDTVRSLLAVGFCGGLTTFSTFGYETLRLFTATARLRAVLNVGVTVVAGIGAATAGLALATALWH